MIEIKNLTASVDGNEILKGINLTVKKGEVHAIMGPNGSGKSTLSKVIAEPHPPFLRTRADPARGRKFFHRSSSRAPCRAR